MRKYCYKYCCKIKLMPKNTDKETSQYNYLNILKKGFDIREKRIDIVFKVIYVVVALSASVFLPLSGEFGKGLSNTYIFYACLLSFLIHLLYRMIIYVFNELKCLKIKDIDIYDKKEDELFHNQLGKTEDSYTRIFQYFTVGGITSILVAAALSSFQEIVTKELLSYIYIFGIIIGSVLSNIFSKKHIFFWHSFCSIVWLIVFIALFSAMAFEGIS